MRITGGALRSRALKAPSGSATRPTSDRVREALFGILDAAGRVRGARVLDLYAGTGALACEALSRGAAHAVVVESARAALAVLRGNLGVLGLTAQTRVLPADLHRSLRQVAALGPFDLALADPPWDAVGNGEPSRVLAELACLGALAPEAWVVLEHASRTPSPEPAGLSRVDLRRYGDTALSFYVQGDHDRPDNPEGREAPAKSACAPQGG